MKDVNCPPLIDMNGLVAPYAQIAAELLSQLKIYLNELGTTEAASFILKRLDSSGHHLGKYAPELLCELLGLPEGIVTLRKVTLWQSMYVANLYVSATVDQGKLEGSPTLVHEMAVVLSTASYDLGAALGDCFAAQETRAARIQASQKRTQELNDRMKFSYGELLARLADKEPELHQAPLIRALAYILLHEEGRPIVDLTGIDLLCSALQLMDDLSDVEIDLRRKVPTLPLAVTQRLLKQADCKLDLLAESHGVSAYSTEELHTLVTASGAFEEICARICSLLNEAAHHLESPDFLRKLGLHVTTCMERKGALREEWLKEKTLCDIHSPREIDTKLPKKMPGVLRLLWGR